MIITILGLILFIRSLITKQYRYILASCAAFFYGIIWTMRSVPQLTDHAALISNIEIGFLAILLAGLIVASVKKQHNDPVTVSLSCAALMAKIARKRYYKFSLITFQAMNDSEALSYFSTRQRTLGRLDRVVGFANGSEFLRGLLFTSSFVVFLSHFDLPIFPRFLPNFFPIFSQL